MIEYIQGKIDELQPTQVVVEAAGVGYLLYISLGTYSTLQGKNEARVYVYEAIREDAHLLFGFATRQERELFLLLILSAFSPSELVGIIQNEDARTLKGVKGIGPKAAARIIVDLKDKISMLEGIDAVTTTATSVTKVAAGHRELIDEAVAALTMLGFSPAPSQKVVKEILNAEPDATVERIIKLSLKML